MQTNLLIQVFRPIVIAGLETVGYGENFNVLQAYQPTTQGTPKAPSVYFYKKPDHRYGNPKWENVWDPELEIMVHREIQAIETTFNFSALVIEDPENISYTATDLLESVAAILQSEAAITSMVSQGVSLYRITEIRNPYFTDDFERFESMPSFDVTFTHSNTITSTVGEIDANSINSGVHPLS